MAVESRKRKSDTVYRAYWRNPFTGKIERGAWTTKESAYRLSEEVKIRLKYERDSFKPANLVESSERMSVAELLFMYHTKAPMTASSRKTTFYHVKSLVEHLGDLSVDKLQRKHLKNYEQHLSDDGIKQNTVQRKISILRAALNWASDKEIIEDHPLGRYKCKRGPDTKLPPPTPSEIELLFRTAPQHIQRVLVLGFNLGLRIGASELFKIQWNNIDLLAGIATIESALKNKEMPYRKIKIKEGIIPLLKKWQEEDSKANTPWVIHWKGKPVATVKKAWKATLKRAGIKRRIRPYDLRHAFATYALEGGADAGTVANIMGQAGTDMIHRHYQQVLDSQKERAIAAIPELNLDKS